MSDKDETKDTEQDFSQDSTKASGDTSGGSKGITSGKTPQTYTQEQTRNMVSDALAKAGRDAQTLEQREAAVKAQEDANKAEQERKDAAELAEAQGDPDKMAVYEKKQAEKQRRANLDTREAELNKREAENAAEIQAAKEIQKGNTIREIATEHKVDPVRLKDLSVKFSIEGKEKLEELADEIGSGKTDHQIDVDSGITSGGKKDLSGKSPMELAREGYSKSK